MSEKVTLSGKPADPNYAGPAPQPIDPNTGMHRDYWVLSEEERKKGLIRPVRNTYKHLRCGTNTVMGIAIAESYAANPNFYTATFCVHCKAHFPVGADGEFVWVEKDRPLTEKVGT